MAAGPSQSSSLKSLEIDGEYLEFCETFSFSDSVSFHRERKKYKYIEINLIF